MIPLPYVLSLGISKKTAVIFGLEIIFACTICGCADDPNQLDSTPETPEVVVNKNLGIGDQCDDSFNMYCDDDLLVYCKSDKVTGKDCADNYASCVTFDDIPGFADCVQPTDATCSKTGKTYTVCDIDSYYYDEVELEITCAKASNGKSYEIIQNTTYCATLCSKGCRSKTCSGASASCSGNTLQYCKDGHQYAVNCENMNTTCDSSIDDCLEWMD